ncbi:hypothetical protein BV898_18375 [Hypsibius exemplaris]|uniref:CUB domain-containing protein n=1 Tax=Hypsibius exemplaris TaxID=2072580 RepID=A0A9X6NP17_HYPEX|nr:hypothetical protein BV898_18375 [Hypsibius exemplaris]
MMRLFLFSAVLALVRAQNGIVLFDGVEAFLESPNYPNSYDNNLDIVATIVGPVGSRLSLSAETFSIERGYDTLTLLEGSTVLGVFSGSDGPQDVRSEGNQVSVRFQTDSSATSSGFRIRITQLHVPQNVSHNVTQHETIFFDGIEAFFQSPNFPYNYNDSLDITTTIVGPVGSRLSFSAEAFSTERSYDTLTLLEGNQVLGVFSGADGPQDVRSEGNQVTARFQSDFSATFPGFRIRITQPTDGGSGGTTTQESHDAKAMRLRSLIRVAA